MMRDRIQSLRHANIYEPQRYRHMVSAVLVEKDSTRTARSTSNFLVIRIMQDGDTMIFASGRYVDRIAVARDALRRARRDLRQPALRHPARDPALTARRPRCIVAAAMLMASGPGWSSIHPTFPSRLQSIQHFYAILKRCETVAPDRNAIRAREAAFDRLLDDAKTPDGLGEPSSMRTAVPGRRTFDPRARCSTARSSQPTSSATSRWCQRCR